MAIPSEFIDDLVARSDILDVVSDYVRLTPKGGSYWGLCPFHGEKTASFHVVPDRQMYHCFGCGKGGGVISFIKEKKKSQCHTYNHINHIKYILVPKELPSDKVSVGIDLLFIISHVC